MGQVVVDKPVHHLAAGALTGDDAGSLEDAQVLTDQGLRYRQRVDEFVHAAGRLVQLQHDRDAHRGGQRAQDVAGGVEDLARRRGREGRFAVLVQISFGGGGHVTPPGYWKSFSVTGFTLTCTIAHVKGFAGARR